MGRASNRKGTMAHVQEMTRRASEREAMRNRAPQHEFIPNKHGMFDVIEHHVMKVSKQTGTAMRQRGTYHGRTNS